MKIKYPSLLTIAKNILICVLLIAIGWYLKGRLSPAANPMMGMGEVYILARKVENKDISSFNNKISYVEAINEVNLLPQVTGAVENILFQEGSLVQEGEVLFEIDPSKYQAAFDLAQARLDAAQANFVKAERDYNRQVKLSDQKFASKATFDMAESAYLQAKAAVEEAKANLDLATIDLDNTKVRSPISGKIGKALVTKGNYVVASQVVLAKIVQINPVRISFSMTDKEFATISKQNYNKDDLKARITLATGEVINEKVVSTFLDNAVNPTTATLSVYADVANDSSMLVPGNYVQSSISNDNPIYAIAVPQTALNYDKDGAFVYVVKIDEAKSKENDLHGVAEQRRVVIGDTTDGAEQVIMSGLNEGEMIVVQGNIKIRNNSPIKIGVLE